MPCSQANETALSNANRFMGRCGGFVREYIQCAPAFTARPSVPCIDSTSSTYTPFRLLGKKRKREASPDQASSDESSSADSPSENRQAAAQVASSAGSGSEADSESWRPQALSPELLRVLEGLAPWLPVGRAQAAAIPALAPDQEASMTVPLPRPAVLVGYQDAWLEVDAACLSLWEQTPLEPYARPKHVLYGLLCPDTSSHLAGLFLKAVTLAYEACNLGAHQSMPEGLNSSATYFVTTGPAGKRGAWRDSLRAAFAAIIARLRSGGAAFEDEPAMLDEVGPPAVVLYVVAPSAAPGDMQATLLECGAALAQPTAAPRARGAGLSPPKANSWPGRAAPLVQRYGGAAEAAYTARRAAPGSSTVQVPAPPPHAPLDITIQVLGADMLHDISGRAARGTAFEVFQKLRGPGPKAQSRAPRQHPYAPLFTLAAGLPPAFSPPPSPLAGSLAASQSSCLHCCYAWLPGAPDMGPSPASGWLLVGFTDVRGALLRTHTLPWSPRGFSAICEAVLGAAREACAELDYGAGATLAAVRLVVSRVGSLAPGEAAAWAEALAAGRPGPAGGSFAGVTVVSIAGQRLAWDEDILQWPDAPQLCMHAAGALGQGCQALVTRVPQAAEAPTLALQGLGPAYRLHIQLAAESGCAPQTCREAGPNATFVQVSMELDALAWLAQAYRGLCGGFAAGLEAQAPLPVHCGAVHALADMLAEMYGRQSKEKEG